MSMPSALHLGSLIGSLDKDKGASDASRTIYFGNAFHYGGHSRDDSWYRPSPCGRRHGTDSRSHWRADRYCWVERLHDRVGYPQPSEGTIGLSTVSPRSAASSRQIDAGSRIARVLPPLPGHRDLAAGRPTLHVAPAQAADLRYPQPRQAYGNARRPFLRFISPEGRRNPSFFGLI